MSEAPKASASDLSSTNAQDEPLKQQLNSGIVRGSIIVDEVT